MCVGVFFVVLFYFLWILSQINLDWRTEDYNNHRFKYSINKINNIFLDCIIGLHQDK